MPLSAQITGPRDSLDVMYLLYNITKAAVLHGTRLMAGEAYLTSRNITVVANCPGWCRVRSLLPGLDLGMPAWHRPSVLHHCASSTNFA